VAEHPFPDPALDRLSAAGCFLDIFFAVWADFEAQVLEGFESGECWRQRVRLGAFAAAGWLRDHPSEARFVFLETLRAGGRLQAERERRLEKLVDLIDRGRPLMTDPRPHGREIAVAVVGGAIGLLVQELQKGESTARVESFVPEFMYMAVLPYLGEEAAREELSICIDNPRD